MRWKISRYSTFLFSLLSNSKVAIVEITSFKQFISKCQYFIDWVNENGKIIFLLKHGEKGIYITTQELEN